MPPDTQPPPIVPWDEHNQKLVSNVHPQGWVNPAPASRYNLVVIGAGTAGLVTAVGATVVATHAGDLIGELTLAMKGKLGLKTIAGTVHPYPTQAEAIRKTGDLYNRTRLTPFVKKLMGRWLQWTR